MRSVGGRTDTGHQQSLRYAEELRELYQRERRRAAELEAVRRVSEAVAKSLDVQEVLEAGLDRTLDATGLDTGAAYVLDDRAGELVMECERGVPEALRGSYGRIPLSSPLAELALGGGIPRILGGPLDDPHFAPPEEVRAAGLASLSVLLAPLLWHGEVIGVLALGSLSGRSLEETDLRTVEALARPIAAAVGRARLHEDLRRVDEERRRLLARLVFAQEEERRRVAADLHDDSIQVMAAVGMELGALRHHAPPEQATRLGELERTISDSTARLRRLMVELRPPGLDRDGLGVALRQTLERMETRDGISWRLDDRLTQEPASEIRVTVYRIVQEALANVRKHSRARRVEVRLEPRDGGVLARVRDDGAGFTVGEAVPAASEHIGLASMRERAELTGGWWRVDSAPSKGTTVEFWIPGGGT